MTIKAIIFDLDGTLTRPSLNFDLIRTEIGLDDGDILTAIQLMDPVRRKQANAVLERHERHAAEHSALNDGVLELFEELRKRHLKIGLLTRNTRENTLQVARQHGLYFDAIFDRFDGPAKPDAHGILKLCNQFNTNPDEAIVVGDFLHDIQAARAAEAISVLIETHVSAEDFKPFADYSISHMNELIHLINTLEQNQY